jgi:LmbE family N-acetylglucosaminyl deacetylase
VFEHQATARHAPYYRQEAAPGFRLLLMIVVVSPHLDDAVLSCWSLLVGPGPVRVLTVLAGEPPEGTLGEWDRLTGATDSPARVRERIEEDGAALRIAGCEGLYLGFLDEQYEPGAQPLADGLRPHLDGADVVYGPKGSPQNDDHVIVRDALLEVRRDLRFYADLPYSLGDGFDLPLELDPRDLAPRDIVLDPQTAARKLEAVRCYRTQLVALVAGHGEFVSVAGLARERVWDPRRS